MGYLALYRKWRPQQLGNLVGQKHVTDTLLNALTSNKVSHAYLFCGPRGTGKTSTAQILARAVNCLDPQNGEPCNKCVSCREILSGASMDVIEIDAASNRGIDEIRELKENIKYFPSVGAKRIYIVDEVHMLTNEAFNALLKTLEEPPEHGLFVLATTEPHKVPLTILSRCQRFDFRPIPDILISKQLREIATKSSFSVTDEAITAITRSVAGSMRDALSVLDQALLLCGDKVLNVDIVHSILGTVTDDILCSLTMALAEHDGATALKLVAQVSAEGKDIKHLSSELTGYLRRLMISIITPNIGAEEAFDAPPQELRQLFNQHHLMNTLHYLVEAEQVMRRSTYPRVVLELALVRSVEEVGNPSIHDLLQRIEKLEQTGVPSHNAQQTPIMQRATAADPKKPSQLNEEQNKRKAPPKQSGQMKEDKHNQEIIKQSFSPQKAQTKPVKADVKQVPSKQPAADEVAEYPPWYATEHEENHDDLGRVIDTWDGLPDWSPIETPPWDQEVPKPESATKQRATQEQTAQRSKQINQTGPTTQIKQTGSTMQPHRETLTEKTSPKMDLKPLDESDYSLGQLNNWWPEILSTVKKSNPLAHSWLSQVWPAEIKEHCLVLGIPQGENFLKDMIESPDKKKLLIQTLNSVTHLNWQISCQFYDDPPPNLPRSADKLKTAEAINLFQGSVLDIIKDK